jgi:cytoskeleton protein RodZ
MGMTLLQAAEKLHVDTKVPEWLEAEQLEALGATVYVKGHLKRYAELVGEDTQAILDLYGTLSKPALPDLTQLPKAQRPANPGKLVVPSLVVLIGLVFVGVVWWILKGVQDGTLGAPVAPHMVESEPPTESAVPPEPPAAAASVSTAPATAAKRPAAGVAPATGNAAANRNTAATGATLATAPQPAAADAPASRTINVTLRFAADSWVEVYDAKGERLFYDIGAAASSRKLTGTPPLRVVLGNAPGVTLDVNGKRARLPANVVTEDSAQFLINSSGRIVGSQPPGDGG